MAAAVLQNTVSPDTLGPFDSSRHQTTQLLPTNPRSQKYVTANLHYFKENEDGSPPHPTYVDKPETYDRPFEAHDVVIRDIAGKEDEYTLDQNGFQIHRHTATEKDFLDDAQIKASYYPETENLL